LPNKNWKTNGEGTVDATVELLKCNPNQAEYEPNQKLNRVNENQFRAELEPNLIYNPSDLLGSPTTIFLILCWYHKLQFLDSSWGSYFSLGVTKYSTLILHWDLGNTFKNSFQNESFAHVRMSLLFQVDTFVQFMML